MVKVDTASIDVQQYCIYLLADYRYCVITKDVQKQVESMRAQYGDYQSIDAKAVIECKILNYDSNSKRLFLEKVNPISIKMNSLRPFSFIIEN